MISFIMPAKNTSLYINDAIEALQKANYQDWELIVINDHSTDNTYDILNKAAEADIRIKVFENKGVGKVAALNYGYILSKGASIKCVDADDMLDVNFFNYLKDSVGYDAMCHDLYITNQNMEIIGKYSINKSVINKDFMFCLKRLKGLPRCSWSFNRYIGDKIFPLPEELPFEDVWFTLIIKKHARKIRHVDRQLYYYRQHDNQVYGGILNFKKDTVIFRANRILKLIETIINEPTSRLVSNTDNKNIFKEIELFYVELAKNDLKIIDIIKADLPLELKLKLTIYRKLSFIASFAVRLKWAIDSLKSNLHMANS